MIYIVCICHQAYHCWPRAHTTRRRVSVVIHSCKDVFIFTGCQSGKETLFGIAGIPQPHDSTFCMSLVTLWQRHPTFVFIVTFVCGFESFTSGLLFHPVLVVRWSPLLISVNLRTLCLRDRLVLDTGDSCVLWSAMPQLPVYQNMAEPVYHGQQMSFISYFTGGSVLERLKNEFVFMKKIKDWKHPICSDVKSAKPWISRCSNITKYIKNVSSVTVGGDMRADWSGEKSNNLYYAWLWKICMCFCL